MNDYVDVENPKKVEEKDTKEDTPAETTEETQSPPVQSVVPHSAASLADQDIKVAAETPVTTPIEIQPPIEEENKNTTDLQPQTDDPKNNSPLNNNLSSEEKDSNIAKSKEKPLHDEEKASTVGNTSKKTENKIIPFKFPSISLNKTSCSESKPAVMTVAPLTKPSSSLPTTSTTTVAGTITHGLYTGISIKKSPPNTLPPFKISTHLLPPRVPPLKLSPPRFSKLETCLRELSSSKKSSASKKSKSSRGSSDKLELKVAQLKSASIKYVAPLVITVPPEAKLDSRKDSYNNQIFISEKKPEETISKAPVEELSTHVKTSPPHIKETPPSPLLCVPSTPPIIESKNSSDEDKMDLDSDLFEGRLVIAEPDIPPKDDSDNSNSKSSDVPPQKETTKPEDSEDEEIDVVDDIDVDSGRGSDISSRTEARSLCGDDDLGSPDSVPKTPEAERHPPVQITNHNFPDPKPPTPKTNGVATPPVKNSASLTNGNDCGVLDLSTCSRKRSHDGDGPIHRTKQVANPAVLDKTRQTTTPCISPNHSPFKVLTPEIPHISLYKSKHESSRGNFKCRGNTLTVINPDPNGNRPKIVIRNLGPRPDRGHERFHHHHHHHNHHHQRM